jgi:hypothetical protein
MDGGLPPGGKVLRIEKEMGVREFDQMVREPEFTYLGSAAAIAQHIFKGMPSGFEESFKA